MTTPNPFPTTGPDLLYVDDLDPLATQTSSELQNLAQDCYHWLLTPPGRNPDNPDRGVDVNSRLSGTVEDLATLPAEIDSDFVKDTRIKDSSSSLAQNPDGTWSILAVITPQDGAVVPLTFGYAQGQGLTLQKWG